jgi:hypothetical protein
LLLVAIEIVWLGAANLLLNSDLLSALINRKPEKFSIHWESARSWYPLRFHARGLVYEQHTWTMDITARATQASASFRLLPLLGLRFVLDDVDAHELSVALLREVPDGEKPAPRKTEPGLRMALEGVQVHGPLVFSFNDVTIAGGEPSLTGNFGIQIRGEMEVFDTTLDWPDAQITLAGQTVAESISLGFDGGVAPFNPKVQKGLALLEQVSGQLDVEGYSDNLRPLQLLFPGVAWIEKIDGAGDVALHLTLEEGKLQPGSDVDVAASGLELSFLGFVADGSGQVTLDVSEDDSGRHGQADIVFESFGLARQGDAEPMARGSGLTLSARAQDLGLGASLDGLDIELQIPDSEVPDVSLLGRSLPPGLGIEVIGGSATLSGQLEAHGREEEAKGVFAIRGNDLEGRFRDMQFGLDLAFDTQISGRDLDDFEVQLVGTEVRLFDGVFDGEATEVDDGWWMTIGIPAGRANLAPPVAIDAELELAMRDTRAMIALFAEVKRWIRHFEGFLTVRDVDGSAALQVVGPKVSVRDISLAGDRLEVMAELELEKEASDGIFWGKLGVFSLGMQRVGEETDFKLVNGREWYEEQRAASWTDRQGDPVDPAEAAADPDPVDLAEPAGDPDPVDLAEPAGGPGPVNLAEPAANPG